MFLGFLVRTWHLGVLPDVEVQIFQGTLLPLKTDLFDSIELWKWKVFLFGFGWQWIADISFFKINHEPRKLTFLEVFMVNNLVFGCPHRCQVRIMSDRKLSVDLRRLWLYLRPRGKICHFCHPKKLMEKWKVVVLATFWNQVTLP